jgi:hypothetical protein
MIAYLTDLEGQWHKLTAFAESSGCVRVDASHTIHVDPGSLLIFGGDAIDRGPSARRIVRALLDARLRHPDRVVLISGNRDLNKMRLVRELAGALPKKAPPEMYGAPKPEVLKWIFANTMGAKEAFEHRRTELITESRDHSDEAVVESFLEDLQPNGDLTRFLAASQLGWCDGSTLVVHGAVTEENWGVVPGGNERCSTTREWIDALNAFHAREVSAWRETLTAAPDLHNTHWPGQHIVDYQCPIGETKLNQASVVYGRPTDGENNPWLPPRSVVARLRRDGVRRLVVGHTPSGDTPAVLRDDEFVFVMADNSYGRVETGSRVVMSDTHIAIAGVTQLDDGSRVEVRGSVGDAGNDRLLGLRDASTGALVKARLATGDYLLFKGLTDNKVSQVAMSAGQLTSRELVAPYRA